MMFIHGNVGRECKKKLIQVKDMECWPRIRGYKMPAEWVNMVQFHRQATYLIPTTLACYTQNIWPFIIRLGTYVGLSFPFWRTESF